MSAGPERPPEGAPAIRVSAMPADTNANGDIFGGWLVSMMDLAAGTVASQRSKGRAATIAIDGMIFHRPVKVGDLVSSRWGARRGRSTWRPGAGRATGRKMNASRRRRSPSSRSMIRDGPAPSTNRI
jgi:acyl-coenzyme A thioesterase PaaI-like protein